eukprot:6174998-Pleurochrysis_carterae.AAC.2
MQRGAMGFKAKHPLDPGLRQLQDSLLSLCVGTRRGVRARECARLLQTSREFAQPRKSPQDVARLHQTSPWTTWRIRPTSSSSARSPICPHRPANGRCSCNARWPRITCDRPALRARLFRVSFLPFRSSGETEGAFLAPWPIH